MTSDITAFKLTDLKGLEYEPNDLIKVDKLNLFIFYNTDCLGCTGRALPFAYDLSKEYSFINLVVVHVAFGVKEYSVEYIKSVFRDEQPPFPIYIDDKNMLYEAWNCEGTPHWVFINKKSETPSFSIFGSQEGAKMKIELAISEMSTEFS